MDRISRQAASPRDTPCFSPSQTDLRWPGTFFACWPILYRCCLRPTLRMFRSNTVSCSLNMAWRADAQPLACGFVRRLWSDNNSNNLSSSTRNNNNPANENNNIGFRVASPFMEQRQRSSLFGPESRRLHVAASSTVPSQGLPDSPVHRRFCWWANNVMCGCGE